MATSKTLYGSAKPARSSRTTSGERVWGGEDEGQPMQYDMQKAWQDAMMRTLQGTGQQQQQQGEDPYGGYLNRQQDYNNQRYQDEQAFRERQFGQQQQQNDWLRGEYGKEQTRRAGLFSEMRGVMSQGQEQTLSDIRDRYSDDAAAMRSGLNQRGLGGAITIGGTMQEGNRRQSLAALQRAREQRQAMQMQMLSSQQQGVQARNYLV